MKRKSKKRLFIIFLACFCFSFLTHLRSRSASSLDFFSEEIPTEEPVINSQRLPCEPFSDNVLFARELFPENNQAFFPANRLAAENDLDDDPNNDGSGDVGSTTPVDTPLLLILLFSLCYGLYRLMKVP